MRERLAAAIFLLLLVVGCSLPPERRAATSAEVQQVRQTVEERCHE